MKIANIVSTEAINVTNEYNVVKSMDEIIHGLPTLLVGFNFVNTYYPDFEIHDRRVADKTYWTLKKTENRDKFNEDIEWFKYMAYKHLFDETTYVFVDPLQYRKKALLKIIKKIYSLNNKISYIHGKMVYIYGDYYIFGVDLNLLEYMGANIDNIISKIKSKSSVFLQGEDIFIEYKKTIEEFDNQIRFIPYLYSIQHEQKNINSFIHIP